VVRATPPGIAGDLTLSVAHGISDQAADAIHAAYPRAEVLVHADPMKIAASSKL
jgi:divalent metal cation (Fe/Co/Zn/Cd) transporter